MNQTIETNTDEITNASAPPTSATRDRSPRDTLIAIAAATSTIAITRDPSPAVMNPPTDATHSSPRGHRYASRNVAPTAHANGTASTQRPTPISLLRSDRRRNARLTPARRGNDLLRVLDVVRIVHALEH